MVPEHLLLKSIILHVQGLNCGEGIYELEDHVGHEALNTNLLPKRGFVKKILLANFSNYLLKFV